MKKLNLVITALLYVFMAAGSWNMAAQSSNLSREVIDRMVAKMKSYSDYRIDFTASSEGMFTDVSGMYVVSGDQYYIKIQRQEQFSDGRTRWEIYPAEKEVVIDYMDLASRNIMSNPTRAFDFVPEEFDSSYAGTDIVNGIECHTIILKPKSGAFGVGNVTLHVSTKSDIPAAISYDFDGEELSVEVDKFTALPAADPALFRFEEAKYEGYEIIDFRDK